MTDVIARLNAALEGRYSIQRKLGEGGMATVYLAARADEAVADARFQREIQVAARLSHPNILTLHDSGEAAGIRYYVMPYVAGETLRERLQREGRLPVDEAVRLCSEVAEALDYAHRAGIVHRDIKPENVMLHEGHAMVADFGIASALAVADSQGLTVTGSVLGTPAYLSPEQVSGATLDGRSDLYSLACLLYECLTGSLPFSGGLMEMMAQRMVKAAPSVRTVRNEVPEGLASVVQRAMATDPEGRYQTGQELITALRSPMPERAHSEKPTLVVLPFTNLSSDPENEFFSDGLTEEIIADLASLQALSVISRTSAMRLKETDKDVRTIGRELGVEYVLEGGVRKAGDRLRITAQLIDAAADEPLWGERFDGTMEDVFEVQERVAREIVAALNVTLTSDEDRRLAEHPIHDVRAFELYLQARQELRRYGPGIDRGEALLARAREIEGDTIPIRALEAVAKVERVRAGLASDHSGIDQAEAVALAILKEDPDSAPAHGLLGFVAYERGSASEAIRHFQRCLEQDPNDVDAFFFLGVTYSGIGKNDEALETARRLVACDPLSPTSWMLANAVTWFVGRAAEGLASGLRALELDATHTMARWCTGYTQLLVGQLEAAKANAEVLRTTAPEMLYTGQLAGLVAAIEGRSEEALDCVEGVAGLDGHHKFHLAEVFAVAGAHERAMELLEDSVETFHPHLFIRTLCPFLEPLRGTPRFEAYAVKAEANSAAFAETLSDAGAAE
jgi:TolB-like protein/Flp pilus assembly protein TadD